MAATRIDLLRHGACDDGNIYRGRTDSLLSPEGAEQMRAASEDGCWDLICSSPLRRCRDFADALASEISVPLIVDERLTELDFGDWDGLPTARVWQQQQQAVLDFWQDPAANPPPGGESLERLRDRAVELLHEIDDQQAGRRILLISHGGVIRALLGYLLQMPLQLLQQLTIDYGSLSRFELYPSPGEDRFTSAVVFINRLTTLTQYDRA